MLKSLDGQLHVAVARDPAKGPDAWVLPKGHVREGETLEQTALRETREEIGAGDIALITYLGVVRRESLQDWGELVDKDIHLFLAYCCGPDEISPDPRETVVESRWMLPAEALARIPWEEERIFLRRRLAPLLGSE